MDLIDVDRLRCQSISTVLAELVIVPDIIIRIVDDRRIIRSGLEMSCEGVTLLVYPVISTDYSVLIAVPLLCIRNLLFPNAGLSSNLLPVKAKGEVRLRSVLSRAKRGSASTPSFKVVLFAAS